MLDVVDFLCYNAVIGRTIMSVDEIITIIIYVVMGVSSIVSAVVTYVKTGKFTVENTSSNADVISTLQEVKAELKELRVSHETLVKRLDDLDERVSVLEYSRKKIDDYLEYNTFGD